MTHIAEYIEKTLEKYTYDDILLKYERNVLEDSKLMAERVRKAGLSDEKVITDLIKASHPDMPAEYEAFRFEELRNIREKKWNSFLAKAVPVWIVLMIATYLGVSFATDNWRESWLIIIGFITVLVLTLSGTLIAELSHRRKLLQPIARVGLALGIMMAVSFIYLAVLMLHAVPHFWVIFPAGVILFLCADILYSRFLKQKLRVINYLVYVPIIATMVFIILCGAGLLPWNPSWLIVIAGLGVDLIIALGKAAENRKYTYRPEDDE